MSTGYQWFKILSSGTRNTTVEPSVSVTKRLVDSLVHKLLLLLFDYIYLTYFISASSH
jgi:hypothetical protein